MDAPDLTIIIPTLNAEAELRDLLAQAGAAYKIIISDGGSKDGTLTVGINSGTQIAMGSAGRGGQLARGAAWAIETGGVDWLLILHADVRLDENWQ